MPRMADCSKLMIVHRIHVVMLHTLQHVGEHARVLPWQIGPATAYRRAHRPPARAIDRSPTRRAQQPDLARFRDHQAAAYVRRRFAASRRAPRLSRSKDRIVRWTWRSMIQRQVVNGVIEGHRFADEKPLAVIHAQLCGTCTDRIGLHVAGHRFHSQGARELCDRGDHGLRSGIVQEITAEAAVDLDARHRQRIQMRQQADSPAEMVERKGDSLFAQPAHEWRQCADVRTGRLLGKFKPEGPGFDAAACAPALRACARTPRRRAKPPTSSRRISPDAAAADCRHAATRSIACSMTHRSMSPRQILTGGVARQFFEARAGCRRRCACAAGSRSADRPERNSTVGWAAPEVRWNRRRAPR